MIRFQQRTYSRFHPPAPGSCRSVERTTWPCRRIYRRYRPRPCVSFFLKPIAAAEIEARQVDHTIAGVGLFAIVLGSGLMVLIASRLTDSLGVLTRSVRAFGTDRHQANLPQGGTREIRQLSSDFATMRQEIETAQRALVEAERLATIGSMAGSISHDLRHYLASAYANAEFLSAADLTEEDKRDLLQDIRQAITGTTEMMESLMLFSRTGRNALRSLESVEALVEHSMAVMRAHPDGQDVKLSCDWGEARDLHLQVNAGQIERVLFNLLLNACQAARSASSSPEVSACLRLGIKELFFHLNYR